VSSLSQSLLDDPERHLGLSIGIAFMLKFSIYRGSGA
jgi:hypothetical protein